jgi:hypothetical protein
MGEIKGMRSDGECEFKRGDKSQAVQSKQKRSNKYLRIEAANRSSGLSYVPSSKIGTTV